MTLLNRYILTAYLRIFLLSLAAFVGIYLLVDFFEKVDDFIEHQARFPQYFWYFFNKVPIIVSQVAPMAVLMGTFTALGGFSRTNELTAMWAGGISLRRITAPLLGIALATALLILAGNEYLLPLHTQKINHILEVEVKGKPEYARKKHRLWIRENDTIYNIRLVLPKQERMQGVSVFEIDEKFQLRRRLDAPEAVYTTGGWLLKNATVRRFGGHLEPMLVKEQQPEIPIALSKPPEDFRGAERDREEFGIRELHRLAEKLQAEGYPADRFRVDMHQRLASPFASVIMAVLGIPFALRRGRKASLAAGITISVAIGIAYHILQAMLVAFGYSAVLPPVVAAWAANVLFGLLGLWLLLTAGE